MEATYTVTIWKNNHPCLLYKTPSIRKAIRFFRRRLYLPGIYDLVEVYGDEKEWIDCREI